MSNAHHSDTADANPESHPVKLAISVVLGAVSLIVGIILVAQFAIGAYGNRSLENDPAMAPEALARRIAPVARLQVEGASPIAPAPQGPKVAAVVAAPAKGGKADGKKVYDTTCMVCHATGVAGAPKIGDKAAWAPRVKTGNDALYASALKGKAAMPPRGGNASLGDDEVKAAVDYMVAGSK
ncbi:MAG: cytochrome c5 family protein [Betaproteobacteria bacterium]|nr:cytochrome c5 family protein [Betaproteobacteria bacterium]